MTYFGRWWRRILRTFSNKPPQRGHLRPCWSPALEKGWHGNPAKDFVGRDHTGLDLANIAKHLKAEVSLIKGSKRFLDFAGEDTAVAELTQRDVETARPREKIDEFHRATELTRRGLRQGIPRPNAGSPSVSLQVWLTPMPSVSRKRTPLQKG